MGIQYKIILPYALLVIVAIAVAGTVSAHLGANVGGRDARMEEREMSMRREIRRVKSILEQKINIPKNDEFLKIINPLFEGQIVLTDENGDPKNKTISDERVRDFVKYLVPPKNGESIGIRRVTVGSQEYYIVSENRGDSTGCVFLIIDAQKLDPSPPQPESMLLFIGAASLAVVLGVGFFITRTITRRLGTLASLTTEIAEGRFDRPVPVKGRDEIATLASAFNRMQEGLRRYREKLIAAEKMAALGLVSASVAHEIRNPLNSIAMNVQMMQRHGTLDNEAIDIIRAEIDRLRIAIDGMLDVAGNSEIEPVEADLNEIVEQTLRLMERRLEHLGIELKRDFAADMPRVRADKNRLKQVVMNLVINGADAMPGGGMLTVRTKMEAGCAVVFVGDSGHGIAPEDRAKVFDMTFSTRPGGTGLGLAISRRIIEEHGGTIDFETSPQGTTFRFDLPV